MKFTHEKKEMYEFFYAESEVKRLIIKDALRHIYPDKSLKQIEELQLEHGPTVSLEVKKGKGGKGYIIDNVRVVSINPVIVNPPDEPASTV